VNLGHITPGYNNLAQAKPGYSLLGQVNSGYFRMGHVLQVRHVFVRIVHVSSVK